MDNSRANVNDMQALELIQPFLDKAEIGMFTGYKNVSEPAVSLAAEHQIGFLRVGANAGTGMDAVPAIKTVKKYGVKCRYSLMKGYILSTKQLAEEAKLLQDSGADCITLMDSAGTMLPDQVHSYVTALTTVLSIPVAFHGHNNLGLAAANALAAQQAGAEEIDVCLMGTGRSAGNLPTEMGAAVFSRAGISHRADFYGLIHFITKELAPQLRNAGISCAVAPVDLVYGYTGCHSNFGPMFERAAKEKGVDLFSLIDRVSSVDRSAPTEKLIEQLASELALKSQGSRP